jgi:hypothetical protein
LDESRLQHAFDMQVIALCLRTNIPHGYTVRTHKDLLPFNAYARPALQLVRDLVTGMLQRF